MKKLMYFSAILFAGFACTSHQQKTNSESEFEVTSKKILETTENYLSGKLANPTISTEPDGVIDIKSPGMLFTVNPYDINIGKLDEDNTDDALVTYTVSPEGEPKYQKHLIILDRDGYKVVKDFRLEFKVMQIANRRVFAERPKISNDSPAHNCSHCKENVQYQLAGDSLVQVK